MYRVEFDSDITIFKRERTPYLFEGEGIGMGALLIAVSPCSLSTASRCAVPGFRWYKAITRLIFT